MACVMEEELEGGGVRSEEGMLGSGGELGML